MSSRNTRFHSRHNDKRRTHYLAQEYKQKAAKKGISKILYARSEQTIEIITLSSKKCKSTQPSVR